jgi:hypothetical protein
MKKKLVIFAFLGLVVLISSPSYGTIVMYNFDINNAGLTGGPWGLITLEDIDAHTVKFTVDPYAAAFGGTNNFGIQTFAFNLTDGLNGALVHFSSLPGGWSYQYDNDKISGFGPYQKFDFLVSGDGSTRQDSLVFTVFTDPSDFGISVATFTTELSTSNYLFAGHIAGFTVPSPPTTTPVTSAFFSTTGPVTTVHTPEPATLLLLSTGLIGLAAWGRKRR